MTSYGSNSAVQYLAFGATDSNQDSRCSTARDVATAFINSALNLTSDLSTVPDTITRCCNLISAGLVLTGQFTVDSAQYHPFVELGLKLLKDLEGDSAGVQKWGTVIPVKRFSGTLSDSDDLHISYHDS